jgi:metallo-beta-lactamase family protein
VFVDSPLANRITGVFKRYATELEDTRRHNIFDNPSFHFVTDVAESMRLNSVTGAVIMAASGMCEAGRIRHHPLHKLHRSRSTILFVGCQAQGSLRRVILEGARTVRISGNDVRARAQIRQIDSATGFRLLEALVRINRERGTTLVIITHNSAIAGIADRVLHFLDGRIARIEHNESPIDPAGIVW